MGAAVGQLTFFPKHHDDEEHVPGAWPHAANFVKHSDDPEFPVPVQV